MLARQHESFVPALAAQMQPVRPIDRRRVCVGIQCLALVGRSHDLAMRHQIVEVEFDFSLSLPALSVTSSFGGGNSFFTTSRP